MKKKLIRITTVPISLDKLLSGQLNYMKKYYEVVAISSDKEKLEQIGVKENVSTFHVEMTRKITPFKDIKSVFLLYRYFKKEQPFIVHSHTPKAGIVGMLAAKFAGVPHRLHTVAGLPLLEESGVKRILLNFVEKLTYACAIKVYPNSVGLREIILSSKYCSAEKVTVLANGSSNGIDTSYFNPSLFSTEKNTILRNELGFSATDFVFVFVGRLVADKGINEMVTAFAMLSKEHSEVKLLLVGDYEADLDPLLPKTHEAINKNSSILTVGFQNDVRPYLMISDTLVFPSYREGFPNVVMQAGAMGLPSIVTDINGCNEIIEEGVNGTIIPVKNTQALFEAIYKISSDKEYYLSLQQNTRNRIVSRYEQKLVWESILAEYKSL